MDRFSRRYAVLAFFAMILLPVGLLVYFSISLSGTAAVNRGERGATDATEESAVFINQRLKTVSDQVDSFGQSQIAPAMGDAVRHNYDLASLQAQLSQLTQSRSGINTALVTDSQGKLLAISPTNATLVGQSFVAEDWYRGVSATGQPYISGISSIASSHISNSVAVVSPIQRLPGQPIAGYLVGAYGADQIQAMVDDFQSKRGIRLTVVDHQGFLVATPGLQPGVPATRSDDPRLKGGLAGHSGVTQADTSSGAIFSAYAPVKGLGWVVMADVPAAPALQDADRLRNTVLVIAAILGAVVVGGMVVGIGLVHRAQQSEALRNRLGSLARLDEAARSVHAQRGEDAVYAIARTARMLVEADLALLKAQAESGPETTSRDGGGEISGEQIDHLCVLAFDAMGEGEGVRLEDLNQTESAAGRNLGGFGPLLAIALNATDEKVGILLLCRAAGAPAFSDEDEALLRQLARHSVTVIERARQDRELDDKNGELALASKLKSEFLANMSHELRTPLSAIIGFSDLILDGADGDLTPDLEEDVTQINTSGKTLLQLINDILDLSKIEAGRMTLELAGIELGGLVKEVMAGLRPLAQSRALDFAADVPEQLTAVRGDDMRVRQVLTNLVSNALKFTSEGGVTIRCQEVGKMVEVSVIDTGIGIPPEALGKIFEEFTQADGSTTRKFGGTGLGLTITRRLIQMQGGDLGVDSKVGTGSRFWFTLPQDTAGVGDRAAVAADSEPSQPTSTGPWAGPTRDLILVVDDEESDRQLLIRRLGEEGFATVQATRAEDAVRMARELHPAAITLDVMMPGIDGWRVLVALKDSAETREIPVIMVSIVDGKEHALELGASAYLVKPFSKKALAATMAGVLPTLQGSDILCVDDEPAARELVSRSLEGAGARVRAVESGPAALMEVDSKAPNAIFVDLMMPEMSGFELIARLRSRPALQSVPIVVLSARELSGDDISALGANIDRFVRKSSVDARDLSATVREAIGHRRRSLPVVPAAVPRP